MTTSTSSKAAALPEWRRAILSTDEAKRSTTQKSILRSIECLESAYEELKKDIPISYKNPHRLLKVCADLVEVSYLRFGGMSVFSVSHQKSDYISRKLGSLDLSIYESSGTFFRTLSASSPTSIHPSEFPHVLTALLYTLNIDSKAAFKILDPGSAPREVRRFPEDEYDLHLAYLVYSAERWSNMRSKWPLLKAAGADSLLKEIGSGLTIDKLSLWAGGIIQVVNIYRSLDQTDPQSNLIPALDSFSAWVNQLKDATDVPSSLLRIVRALEGSVSSAPRTEVVGIVRPSFKSLTPRLRGQIVAKIEAISVAAHDLFLAELNAAKAAEPADPARIALASYHYATYAPARPPSQHSQIEEHLRMAEISVAKCKFLLPPDYYRGLKYLFNAQKQILFNLNYHGMDGFATAVDDFRKGKHDGDFKCLRARCAFCDSLGSETPLQCCAQCRSVYYCSKDCQKKHWKVHKKECKSLAEAAAAAAVKKSDGEQGGG